MCRNFQPFHPVATAAYNNETFKVKCVIRYEDVARHVAQHVAQHVVSLKALLGRGRVDG